MNRVRDYIQFTVWFVGLGYIVLWPLTANNNGISPLAASFVCGGSPFDWVDMVCHSSHTLQLSPGLHLIGLMSAGGVLLRVLARQLRRSRRASTAGDVAAAASSVALRSTLPRWPRQETLRPLRPVKPRKHFGLRGAPH